MLEEHGNVKWLRSFSLEGPTLRRGQCAPWQVGLVWGQMEPDQVHQGITSQDFPKTWQGLDIQTKMHILFLNLETIALGHWPAAVSETPLFVRGQPPRGLEQLRPGGQPFSFILCHSGCGLWTMLFFSFF